MSQSPSCGTTNFISSASLLACSLMSSSWLRVSATDSSLNIYIHVLWIKCKHHTQCKITTSPKNLFLFGLCLIKRVIYAQTYIISFIDREILFTDNILKFKEWHKQWTCKSDGHSFNNCDPTPLFGPNMFETPGQSLAFILFVAMHV